jgi:hypothetical protein
MVLVASCGGRSGYGLGEPAGPTVSHDVGVRRVEPLAPRVFAGREAALVRISIENQSPEPLLSPEIVPRFERAGVELTEIEWRVETWNPQRIEPGKWATLLVWFDVARVASTGSVSVGATVRWSAGGVPYESAAVDEPGSFEIVLLPELTVTTRVDEDDIGADPPTVTAAGAELSLREALRIAAAGSAHVIRFDATEFPPDRVTAIVLVPTLGPLPIVTVDGTAIDANDAGVQVDGSQLTGVGLDIRASDVTVQHLSLLGFGTDSPYGAIRSFSAGQRLAVVGGTYDRVSDWGTAPGIVEVEGGSDHVVFGAEIRDSVQEVGLRLTSGTSGAVVAECTFIDTLRGLELSGAGHLVLGSAFSENEVAGVHASGVRSSRCAGLIISRTASGAWNNNNGLLVESSTDVRFEQCTFARSTNWGVMIRGASSGVSLLGGTFDSNGSGLVTLEAGSNEDVGAPVIGVYEPWRVSGTGSPDGARVEVYEGDSRRTFLVATVVEAGVWSVAVPDGTGPVSATLTTPLGSTSRFSSLMAAP